MMETGPLLRSIEAPYDLSELPASLTVLPESRRGDQGVYPFGSESLVKELRAVQVPAAFLDRSEDRVWHERLGDVTHELVIGVVSGLLSAAMWQAVIEVIDRLHGRRDRVHIRFLRIRPDKAEKTSTTWFDFEGAPRDLGDAWRDLNDSGD